MAVDPRETKIRYTLASNQGGESSSHETIQISAISRWKIYLILVLAFLAVAFLSILFFSLLLPLVLGSGMLLGVWVWWIRHKLLSAMPAEILEENYAVVYEYTLLKRNAVRRVDNE